MGRHPGYGKKYEDDENLNDVNNDQSENEQEINKEDIEILINEEKLSKKKAAKILGISTLKIDEILGEK